MGKETVHKKIKKSKNIDSTTEVGSAESEQLAAPVPAATTAALAFDGRDNVDTTDL